MSSFRACLLAAALSALALPDHAPAQTLVRGRLVDEASGTGIAQGRIVISANRGRWRQSVNSDSTGAFSFTEVRPGPYRLIGSRMGYREVQGSVMLATDSVVDVVLRMDARTVVLEPVTVVTRSRRQVSPILAGFYHRMENGMGHFITRQEIEQRRPTRVSDLLRGVASLRVAAGRAGIGGGQMYSGSSGELCPVIFFVDGMPVNLPTTPTGRRTARMDAAVDDYVGPLDVEGIEIYRGESDTPAQFITRWVGCGTIVIWTRRG